jgi:branched-chain amino acid transport system substrate-binding protein
MTTSRVDRADFLKGAAAAGVAAAATNIPQVAFAQAPRTIKIGLVQPMTGPLAFFTEHMPFVLAQIKQKIGTSIDVGGTKHPYEIIIKDSQSSPNRASEVARELILQDKVDLITTYATPETVNPVSDQCEMNGVPCISNDAPLEPYFFGRKGDPKKGFEWTYHFFFSAGTLAKAMLAYWNKLPTDKVLGGLWGNDGDGIAQSKVFAAEFTQAGYKVVDPGRFDMPASSYNAQIAAFSSGHCDIIQGVLPPPEFTAFWNGVAQQGYKPKSVYVGKACEFPEPIYALHDRCIGLTVETWWSKFHPYSSHLIGLTSRELADSWEAAEKRQYSMALGFRHALWEVVFDVLKRTHDVDKAASIRDAARTTKYESIVGPIDFRTGPFPNCAETPLVVSQWFKGSKYPYELAIVDNTTTPIVPVNHKPELIHYS